MSYIRKTSDLFISDELREVLESIKANSEVARLLLKFRHNNEDLVEGFVNYISTSKKDPKMISYLSPERKEMVGDEIWTSPKRFIAKPGSFVKKVFKNVSDKEIENFSNLYRNSQNKEILNFEIVSGESIRKWYYEDNYQSNSSSLGSSCMRYDSCQNYMDLYCQNQDVVQMLILLDGHRRLVGRALLWNTEPKVMDRIYTVNDERWVYHFQKWAKENGYLYKYEQKWNNTLHFSSQNEEKTCLELSVKLNKFDFEYYPYLDTFKFLDSKNGMLYNYQPNSERFITLSSGNGDTQNRNFLKLDDLTKIYHYESEIFFVDYLNLHTHESRVYYSEVNDCYILRSDSIYSHELGDYIFKDSNKNNFESISEKINIEIEKSQSMIDEFLKAGKQSRTNFYRERIIELQSYLKKITISEEMV
jgi:hypothetical protein